MLYIQLRDDILKPWKVYFTFWGDGHEKPSGGTQKGPGIRQEDLARDLQVSRQTISSLEKGRYNPSIQLAFKIARYFHLTIEDVFVFEEEQS